MNTSPLKNSHNGKKLEKKLDSLTLLVAHWLEALTKRANFLLKISLSKKNKEKTVIYVYKVGEN